MKTAVLSPLYLWRGSCDIFGSFSDSKNFVMLDFNFMNPTHMSLMLRGNWAEKVFDLAIDLPTILGLFLGMLAL